MRCEPTAPLRADVVYRTPLGRLCRWVPLGGAQRQVTSHAYFQYVDGAVARHGERAPRADGFVLSPENYRVLRVEGAAR